MVKTIIQLTYTERFHSYVQSWLVLFIRHLFPIHSTTFIQHHNLLSGHLYTSGQGAPRKHHAFPIFVQLPSRRLSVNICALTPQWYKQIILLVVRKTITTRRAVSAWLVQFPACVHDRRRGLFLATRGQEMLFKGKTIPLVLLAIKLPRNK